MRPVLPLRQRFDRLWIPVPESGCWVWTGWFYNNGYGCWQYERKKRLAHREAWMLFNGEIPPGIVVCHRCDVKCCVNPSHLFLGTQAENLLDARNKGRSCAVGERNPCAKLSESDVNAIRLSGGRHEDIARSYGIARQTVGRIKSRKDWKHV